MEFRDAEVKVAISGAEDPVASPPPEAAAAPPPDHSFSRDTSDDTEPVSIIDLEAVFQPGHAPPLWGSGADPVPPDSAPAPPSSDAGPVSSQPVSDRDLLFEASRPDTAPPPAIRRRPSFFDVDDAPAPRSRLFDAAPAPFDPHVPALPVRLDAPTLPDDDGERSSGLLDIRSLVGSDHDRKKKARNESRADDDIFNLSGGLFANGGGPLIAPDLNALIAPVLPESSRTGAASSPRKSVSPRPRAVTTSGALSVDTGPAGAHAPVGSERRVPAAASRHRARAGWAVAITAIGAGLLLLSLELGKQSATPTETPAETASLPPLVAIATAKPALPVATTPPTATPAPTVAARDPGTSIKREKDPVAPGTATVAPRSTAPSAATAAVATPVVAAPIVTAAPVAVPPPPPAAGAEFDRSAAISALAAAAGRASGCKQADDPSGGARVSVTFAPSGRVTSSKVTGPPFQGTVTGGCIASAFRSASVPPFDGSPVTVTKDVSIR